MDFQKSCNFGTDVRAVRHMNVDISTNIVQSGVYELVKTP